MNISKIAELAGVSKATVSRYLNNGYVSKEKKAVIQKVIEENNYMPLSTARNLRTKHNYLIGVIIPKLSSESVARMIDGISEIISDTEYNIVLGITNLNQNKELDFLKIFKGNSVDGIIYIATEITRKNREIIMAYNKPVVILGQENNDFASVFHDDLGGAYSAVSHLIQQGCKKIACVGAPIRDKAAGKSRILGYSQAMSENSLTVTPSMIFEGDFSIESGYNAAQKLLTGTNNFDGFFCATDNMAIGVMQYLNENKIIIPDKVKIAAVGDSKMSRAINPALTTVHLFYRTAGREAAQLLMEQLEKNIILSKNIRLGYKLMIRYSSKAV